MHHWVSTGVSVLCHVTCQPGCRGESSSRSKAGTSWRKWSDTGCVSQSSGNPHSPSPTGRTAWHPEIKQEQSQEKEDLPASNQAWTITWQEELIHLKSNTISKRTGHPQINTHSYLTSRTDSPQIKVRQDPNTQKVWRMLFIGTYHAHFQDNPLYQVIKRHLDNS